MFKVIILAVLCFSAFAQLPSIGTFKNFQGINPLECIDDSAQFIKAAKILADQIVTNVQDYTSIVNDINSVLTVVTKLLPDCGVNADLNATLSGFINYSNSTACIADIEQIVGAISKISEDLNNKDFNSLLQDALALIQVAQQTIADCKGAAQPVLLQATINTTGINYTWCMEHATKMVSQFELFYTENQTNLDFNHHVNHVFNATNATYQMFTTTCGMQFIHDIVEMYIPIECLAEVKNAAINTNTVAQNFQTNPFGVLSQMSAAMNSFNNMKILCPFMVFMNQTDATTLFALE